MSSQKGFQTRATLTNPNRIDVYVSESERIILEKFKQICEREGSSASGKIREFIRDYVRLHEPGNPQMLMERFTGEAAQPLPRWLTCRHSRRQMIRGEFYCNRKGFWGIPRVCDRCYKYRA